MNDDKKKDGLNIELSDTIAEGTYSNLAIINHSPSEFVVDFIQMMPGIPKAKVKSRVILTPQHAKRFMKALSENVRKFENQHDENVGLGMWIMGTQYCQNHITTNVVLYGSDIWTCIIC